MQISRGALNLLSTMLRKSGWYVGRQDLKLSCDLLVRLKIEEITNENIDEKLQVVINEFETLLIQKCIDFHADKSMIVPSKYAGELLTLFCG